MICRGPAPFLVPSPFSSSLEQLRSRALAASSCSTASTVRSVFDNDGNSTAAACCRSSTLVSLTCMYNVVEAGTGAEASVPAAGPGLRYLTLKHSFSKAARSPAALISCFVRLSTPCSFSMAARALSSLTKVAMPTTVLPSGPPITISGLPSSFPKVSRSLRTFAFSFKASAGLSHVAGKLNMWIDLPWTGENRFDSLALGGGSSTSSSRG
mmetsp:Transcript_15471/g.36255  ORF Transcript_15471/g.36255 Transcript_15471/m.36255 type:complete len:211 (-) Transcript_15471:121-753(-)